MHQSEEKLTKTESRIFRILIALAILWSLSGLFGLIICIEYLIEKIR